MWNESVLTTEWRNTLGVKDPVLSIMLQVPLLLFWVAQVWGIYCSRCVKRNGQYWVFNESHNSFKYVICCSRDGNYHSPTRPSECQVFFGKYKLYITHMPKLPVLSKLRFPTLCCELLCIYCLNKLDKNEQNVVPSYIRTQISIVCVIGHHFELGFPSSDKKSYMVPRKLACIVNEPGHYCIYNVQHPLASD